MNEAQREEESWDLAVAEVVAEAMRLGRESTHPDPERIGMVLAAARAKNVIVAVALESYLAGYLAGRIEAIGGGPARAQPSAAGR